MKGYRRHFRPRRGGVKTVALVDSAHIERIDYNTAQDGCTAVVLRPGAAFAPVELPEDRAEFEEQVFFTDGCQVVMQKLVIPFEGLGPQENAAVKQLSERGVVALVQTGDGPVYLLGHSPRLAAECALRLAQVKSSSHVRFEDSPIRAATLVAESDQMAPIFTGDFTALLERDWLISESV